jgi:hypothetical protein
MDYELRGNLTILHAISTAISLFMLDDLESNINAGSFGEGFYEAGYRLCFTPRKAMRSHTPKMVMGTCCWFASHTENDTI